MRTALSNRNGGRALVAALALVAGLLPAIARPEGESQGIVEHPRKLEFPPLEFTPPDPKEHRHQIPDGPVVFVVEDRSLPLVDIDVRMRIGSYLDPEGSEGLAAITANQMRAGGTRDLTPEEFDEEADFLAAEIMCSFADYTGVASLGCLTKDLDRSLDLFFDMLARPRFDEDRLAIQKERILQGLARRNDSTDSIENREWTRLLYGAEHFSAELPTRASIEKIDRDALIAFHRRWVHPANWVIAVSGDIDAKDVLPLLERHLRAGFEEKVEPAPPVPAPQHDLEPGVWIVDKEDVNQGRVSAGHLAVERDHPDYHALLVMNGILGGSGFTSRIMSRVRSDEGLAYTARSEYRFGIFYPGEFHAYFQSKSRSVPRALEIVIDEIERIRREPVSAEELAGEIEYVLGLLPRSFTSAAQVANTFASDELLGRPADFWPNFAERVRAVTADDVLRVAREHLHPDRLVVLIVGNRAEILAGDPDHPESTIATIAKRVAGEEAIRRIPLPDPETLVYPETK